MEHSLDASKFIKSIVWARMIQTMVSTRMPLRQESLGSELEVDGGGVTEKMVLAFRVNENEINVVNVVSEVSRSSKVATTVTTIRVAMNALQSLIKCAFSNVAFARTYRATASWTSMPRSSLK